MADKNSRLNPSRLAFALVFLAALIVRLAAVTAQFPLLDNDPDGYRHLAVMLRQTGTFGFKVATTTGDEALPTPTAYRPPLYPLLLAGFVNSGSLSSAAIAGLHVVLGSATVVIAFLLACRVGLSVWAYLTAVVTALDPILLRQSALAMTETLAAFLAISGVAALTWREERPSFPRGLVAGAVLGLAVLCRPTFAAWIVLAATAILAGRSAPNRFRKVGAMLLGAAAVLAPWGLRNAIQLGSPIVTTTHGGYTLWLANNDAYYDQLLQRGGLFDAETMLTPRLNAIRVELAGDEIAVDRRLSHEALETIRRRPGAFAVATLHRVHSLWRLTPRPPAGSEATRHALARMAVGVWYGAVFLLAVLGLWARRGELARSPWLWGLLLGLALTFVHAVYWTDMRMRAPLIPTLAIAAAAGVQWVSRSRQTGRAA